MKKLAFVSIIFIVLSALSAGIPVSGEVPWEVGDSYTYTSYFEGAFVIEEDIGYSSSGSSETTRDYLINEINETAKTVNYETINTIGDRFNFTSSYNSTVVGTNFGDFGAYYNHFANGSGYYISGIYFSSPFLDLPIVVESEFEEINNAYAETFNISREIFSVYHYNYTDWTQSYYEYFTLGEFLDSMTFWNIQGESNADDVKDALEDSRQRSYILEFDLSGVAIKTYADYVNGSWTTVYNVYDEYKYIVKWDYQSNGELNSYSYDFRSSYTRENATISDHNVYEIKQGGSAANNTNIPGFGLITAVASLFVLPLIIRRRK